MNTGIYVKIQGGGGEEPRAEATEATHAHTLGALPIS